uniref:Protein trichome birefringence-like 2 n=1 Tax=Nelumbo nucifera TaxID=4432 RepID=A0A822YTU3_NELNU|nr:TPA_asm: hypothetical protein HUJ06_005175 [Nelumbo nucifera]
MDLKKLVFSEQFSHAISSRRKIIFGFGLGIGVSLFVLSIILLSNPFIKGSLFNPMFQGFNSITGNSSLVSWPFSFSNVPTLSSSSSSSSSSGIRNSTDVLQTGGEEIYKMNASEKSNNANVLGSSRVEVFIDKTRERNSSEKEAIVNEKREGNTAEGHAYESLVGKSKGKDMVTNETSIVNDSNNRENVKSLGGEKMVSARFQETNLPVTDSDKSSYNDSGLVKRVDSSFDNCDIFDGKWVRDDGKPYYPAGSCPYIDRDFDCHLNGRPDDAFLRWRWQPNRCDIPSLNATDFLERMRGKRLVFVGDSLNRNMWESLVCILRHGLPDKSRVLEISGRKEFKTKGFYAFRYEDYNCSLDFVSCPFLVRESSNKRKNGSIETLRLDLMDTTTSLYREADIVVFNTGHWWTHEKTSRGEDYYQEGNYVHPKLKVMEAYKKALTTWARWVDKNINASRTQVFFRGYSVTHFKGGQWNSGGQCHKESEPIFNETYLGKYPSKMRALDHVLQQMHTPVIYLNISRLTDYRKDGHPSIYRKVYKTVEEQIAAEKSQDCSHWCLPGVPDTWNELLYASLLKADRGSWKT